MVTTFTLIGSMLLGGYVGAAGEEVFEKNETLFDLRPIEQKSTNAERINGDGEISPASLSEGPFTANSKIKGNRVTTISSDKISATATSNATRVIDSIYAKARLYENGGLLDSKENPETNSSHAGVTAGPSSFGLVTWDNDAYGNHTYKDAGWKDVVHETYTSSF